MSVFRHIAVGGFIFESAQDSLTAHAGGGQSSAFQMTAEINRFTTVATAGDSAMLPPATGGTLANGGLSIVVINHGANAMQVFGQPGDQINDVATGTGVSQMANSAVLYICTSPGNWYSEGLGTGYVGGLQTLSFANGLTAHAGGGQGSALALTAAINRVTTVATAGDSVALPAAAAGMSVTVINSGANPMQVFGAGTDTINGIATATGISQIQNSVQTYTCTVAGAWQCATAGQGFSSQFPTVSTANALTAHAGGGQGSALPITTVISRFTTVGSANDSAVLPASAPGMELTVVNAAAVNSMNVFPASGESINALSANTAFAVAAGKTATFFCTNSGQWHSILTA